MITPKWRWLKRGFQTQHPPRLEEIMQSVHPDVKRLAAAWKGPGWYPAPVNAQVEAVGDDEYHVTFWPCDPGSRAMGDEPYVDHGLASVGAEIKERFDVIIHAKCRDAVDRLRVNIAAILADTDSMKAGEAYQRDQDELAILRRLEQAVFAGDAQACSPKVPAILTEYLEWSRAAVDARRGGE